MRALDWRDFADCASIVSSNICSFLRRGDLGVVSHKRRRLEDAGAAEGIHGADKDKWIEELEKDIEDLRGEYIRHVVAVQEI